MVANLGCETVVGHLTTSHVDAVEMRAAAVFLKVFRYSTGIEC